MTAVAPSERIYTLTVPLEETPQEIAAKYLPLFRPCNPGKDTRVVRVRVIVEETA